MKLTDLNNSKIAIWGKGQEGLASANFIEKFIGIKNIPFLDDYDNSCMPATVENLKKFDYIVKSPGVSSYKKEYTAAKNSGVKFLTSSGLWFILNKSGKKICITGSKGKSTTSSLLAFLLKELGFKTLLCGNIGIPLTSEIAINDDYNFYVIELSSYQIKDLNLQGISVGDIRLLLNLYPEHIDWHLTTENYFNDKISFLDQNGLNIISSSDINTQKYLHKINNPFYYNHTNSYHLNNADIYFKNELFYSGKEFPLLGQHYLIDLIAVFEILNNLNINPKSVLEKLKEFKPLPHRMNILGRKDNITYIDDSISTIPETSIAALESISGKNICLLAGGFERQQNWDNLVLYSKENDIKVICLPENGKRLFEQLQNKNVKSQMAKDLKDAIELAKLYNPQIILLSPGAPSYGSFKNYIERGVKFKELVGF